MKPIKLFFTVFSKFIIIAFLPIDLILANDLNGPFDLISRERSLPFSQHEELKPIRFGKLIASVLHQGSQSSAEQSRLCKIDSTELPVFETRKTDFNFYITPNLGSCDFITAHQKKLQVYIGGVIALERPTGLAEKDQKVFMLNVTVYDPELSKEVKFDSNWAGIEDLKAESVNLFIRSHVLENINETFWVQARLSDL